MGILGCMAQDAQMYNWTVWGCGQGKEAGDTWIPPGWERGRSVNVCALCGHRGRTPQPVAPGGAEVYMANRGGG